MIMKQLDSTIYKDNLIIRTMEDGKKYAHLTKITGDLYIHSSANLDALKSVGGDLYIHSSANLDAPKLESVGGYLSIHSGASLIANKFYTGGYDKFKVYDNIGCVTLSSKQKSGVTILSCRHSKIKNQKVIGDKFYVAQSGNNNAHGKTIEEALRELQFKIGKRDISEFKNMPKDSKKTPDEWAFIYRMVTGACQYGVKRFMESKGKLKAQYTLTEILEQTKGVYGHEKFMQVVAATSILNFAKAEVKWR